MPRSFLPFASLALAALPAQAAAQPPAAPDWKPLSDSQGFMSFAWDPASVVREGDLVRVVVRVRARIVSPNPPYADFLTEIRCSDARTRVVRTTNYDRKGEPIVDDSPKAKFRRIKSPSDGRLRGALCPPRAEGSAPPVPVDSPAAPA